MSQTIDFPTPAQALLRWSREKPGAIAVESPGESATWQQLAVLTAQLAQALHEAGLAGGQLVGICSRDRFLVLPLIMAIETLGAVHSMLRSAELTADDPVARRCDLLLGTDIAPLRPGQRVLPLHDAWLQRVVSRPASAEAASWMARPSPPQTPVRIGRTSGTTEAPKLMLNRRGLLNELHWATDHFYRPATPEQVYLCLYFPDMRAIYACLMRSVLAGNRIVLLEQVEQLAQLPDPGRCRIWMMAREAAQLAELFATAGRSLGLHHVAVAGGHVSPALHAAMQRTLSPDIINSYSSNETYVIAYTPPAGPGAIAPRAEVRIVDDAMRPLPPGEIGQIAVRGPRVVEGYLWDPALTARHFRDGWFLTADLGRMPSPQQLEVLGRADEMLNVGGRKLAPGPLEQQLKALLGVRDVALLRAEDVLGVGQLVVVVAADADAVDAALADRVRTLLEPQYGTIALHVRRQLPRTATGKLRRAVLAADLAGAPGAAIPRAAPSPPG